MAAAAVQQTSIIVKNHSPPSSKLHAKPTIKLFLSSNLKTPKLTIKPLLRRHSGGRGASVARMADTAAGRYANALADVAKSNSTLDQTYADIEKLDRIFSDEQVTKFFANPTIDEAEKREIIDQIAKSLDLQAHVANFVNILLDMKRIDLFKEIAKEFEVFYNKLTETELAIITSVVQLEPQHLRQIAKRVQRLTGARNVRIKTVIDPALVAGFTIRYGDSGSKLIDMSVKKQLDDIAAQLDIGEW